MYGNLHMYKFIYTYHQSQCGIKVYFEAYLNTLLSGTHILYIIYIYTPKYTQYINIYIYICIYMYNPHRSTTYMLRYNIFPLLSYRPTSI